MNGCNLIFVRENICTILIPMVRWIWTIIDYDPSPHNNKTVFLTHFTFTLTPLLFRFSIRSSSSCFGFKITPLQLVSQIPLFSIFNSIKFRFHIFQIKSWFHSSRAVSIFKLLQSFHNLGFKNRMQLCNSDSTNNG